MGFGKFVFDLLGGVAKAALPSGVTGEAVKCCEQCKHFDESTFDYDRFICKEKGEIRFDPFDKNQHYEKVRLCCEHPKNKYGKTDYFKWK